ncbi:MAG TPA: diaminopimelate decarboxylase, partial [Clostridia bacterium]|nr:diaminopimelate decarboxylase [Clostridia bacterium]
MNFRDTLKIEGNDLVIGGLTASELRERFGTPLYVMDESYIREVSRSFQKTIEAFYGEGAVAFASKAFSAVAMYKIMNSEGLSIDVVSGGELFAALRAGFPPERIYFHGNNKLFNEIEFAVLSGVGNIV